MAKETRTTGAGRRSSTGSARASKTAAASATRRTTREAAKPAKAVKSKAVPSKTVKSVKAKKSAQSKAPSKQSKPTRATKTARSAQTTKARVVKSAKPSAKAVAKTAKSAKAAKSARSSRTPAKATKPSKPAKTSRPTKAVKGAKVAAKSPVKAAKTAKAVKAAKVVKGPPALVPKPAPSRPVLSEVVARRHRSPAVAASTLERLRVQLIDERAQHVRQAEGLLAEAEALANEREPGDTQFDEESGEGDTLSVERERDLALSASARQTVDDIAKALARMDDGSYGYCEVCGDRIPVPRLEAIPWADQCVKCKSRGERRR